MAENFATEMHLSVAIEEGRGKEEHLDQPDASRGNEVENTHSAPPSSHDGLAQEGLRGHASLRHQAYRELLKPGGWRRQ